MHAPRLARLLHALGLLTHLLAAWLPLTWHWGLTGHPPALGLALLAGLWGWLPDMDTQASWLGRALPFLSEPLERRFGHRTVTHSLPALALCGGLAALLYGAGWRWLAAAYGLHLVVDMLVGTGVPLLYPLPHRFYIARWKAGSSAELLFTLGLALLHVAPLLRPQTARTVVRLAPAPATPTPVPTPTPVTLKIQVAHVYDWTREIRVRPGDVVAAGEVLARLETYYLAQHPTPTATLTPSPTPSPTPTRLTPTVTPYPTAHPLVVTQIWHEYVRAAARYQQLAATGTPDPAWLAQAAAYPEQIRQREDCLAWHAANGTLDSWQAGVCREELGALSAESTAVARRAQPDHPDALAVNVAWADLEAARLRREIALLTVTPAATVTPQPTPTPTATARSTPGPALPTVTATPPPWADDYTVYAPVDGVVVGVRVVSAESNWLTVEIVLALGP